MTHRRYLPISSQKPQPFQPPLRNNETRLKNIYEAQFMFKDREPVLRKSVPRSTHKKPQQLLPEPKMRSQIQHLNLADLRPNQRYKQSSERDSSYRDSYHIQAIHQHDKGRYRYNKEQTALTSRNRDQSFTDRGQLFKIRRKSISGSLKKKIKQQNAQYSSANPVIPSELNYYDEARKLYKEGKVSQALRLFQLCIEKYPQIADSYYYGSLCLLSKHNYQKAYDLLIQLMQKFPKYGKKTVFMFTAIAAKHLEKYQQALLILNKGIEKHPQYLDLYLYRGKLYYQKEQYALALSDYEAVLKSKKDNSQVMFECALCYKALGKMSNCVSMLNAAIYAETNAGLKSKMLIQRVKVLYSQKKIKQCKKDLIKLQQLEADHCEMHYYIGLIQLVQNNKKGALLSFEKCIRSNTCPQAVAQSLIQIAKSKIEDRDFYSAYYHINRSSFLQIQSEEINKFHLFTEGVVFLMKRKINQGVSNLNKLQQKYTLGPYFNNLFFLYRAFGHFMQNKHDLAIKDYMEAEKYVPKDKHVTYNQLIAEGIVFVNQSNYQKALQKFDKAQSVISTGMEKQKIQPYIYRAITFTQKTRSSYINNEKVDDLQTLQQIFVALKELDKAYDVNDSNSNMLYLRALIYMYLGKNDEGLQDIIKAISKSQENVAKYFFFRALTHQTLGSTKQALNDFNICINLDQKYARAYFERAKLFFSNQQTSKGMDDLRKYKELCPEDGCKVHQCSLNYLSKQYQLAEACLQEIQDQKKRNQLQLFLLFKQLRISQVKGKLSGKADKMICDVILGQWEVQQVDSEELQFFNLIEYHCYLGIKNFNLGQYEEAINQFSMAIKEKTLMDLQQNVQNQTQEQSQEDEGLDIQIDYQTKPNELHYLNYNLFLSYLANGQRKRAYQIFVRDLLPAKQSFLRSESVGALSKLLFQALKIKENQVPKKQKDEFQFCMFRSVLGESTEFVQIQLSNFILRSKLCYLMPYAKQIHLQYSPKINPSFILSCLKISEVQNRPEPPWVKRNNQDLIFTDQVININVEFQTTQHDEENEDEEEYEGDQEQQGEEEEASGREETVQREETPFDPRRFRDQMKLDDDIERKLRKIMQGKKE